MAVFTGRRARDPRLPPGQHDVGDGFPVLTAEATPNVTPASWTFWVEGEVADPARWTWDEVRALARERARGRADGAGTGDADTYDGDVHCVTTWSKLGTRFRGLSLDALLARVGVAPTATHVVAWSATGYTTNLPLADVTGGRAWLVWEHEGRALSADHGGPVRMIVPHLYFWKSVKWVAGLRVLDHDEPGFWETNGYHDRGDPWSEQRYQGD